MRRGSDVSKLSFVVELAAGFYDNTNKVGLHIGSKPDPFALLPLCLQLWLVTTLAIPNDSKCAGWPAEASCVSVLHLLHCAVQSVSSCKLSDWNLAASKQSSNVK
jgi:hypothetical protein